MYSVGTGPEYRNRHFRMIQADPNDRDFKICLGFLVAATLRVTYFFKAPSPDFGSEHPQKRMPMKNPSLPSLVSPPTGETPTDGRGTSAGKVIGRGV